MSDDILFDGSSGSSATNATDAEIRRAGNEAPPRVTLRGELGRSIGASFGVMPLLIVVVIGIMLMFVA